MYSYQNNPRDYKNKGPTNASPTTAGSRGASLFVDNRPQSAIQKKQVNALANRQVSVNPIQRKANPTGLPDNLKTGIENLSGHSTDDVNGQYNSDKPAHTYAQDTAIHIVPGQEKHVVQQERIKPTMQMRSNNNVQTIQFKTTFSSGTVVQPMFAAHGEHYEKPKGYDFSLASALNATKSMARGAMAMLTGRGSGTGVKTGDAGSYSAIKHLEQTGDGLTGDHQPSGASVKENIRLKLHSVLNRVLTREMARNAYNKAITLVMPDSWHKSTSRTYGGRNSSSQISADAQDPGHASMEDWKKTVPELMKHFTKAQIKKIWNGLNYARRKFFKTGNPQVSLR